MDNFGIMVVETLIKIITVIAVFSALAGFATYVERKVLAFMQRRLGPMHVGPYGLLQILADGIKLFTKEDIVPQNAIKPIFMIAPVITAATAFIAMAAIPFLPEFQLMGHTVRPIISDVNIGVLLSFPLWLPVCTALCLRVLPQGASGLFWGALEPLSRC